MRRLGALASQLSEVPLSAPSASQDSGSPADSLSSGDPSIDGAPDASSALSAAGASGSAGSANSSPQSRRQMHPLFDQLAPVHHQGMEKLRWNGWGYADTAFKLNEKGEVYLTGNRYSLCNVPFPKLRPWAEEKFGLNINEKCPPNLDFPRLPPPTLNGEFLRRMEELGIRLSTEPEARILHSHGHTCEEIWRLRYGGFDRYVDAVCWPRSHQNVEQIVEAAVAANVCLIPYGGGTSVSEALLCPARETRMILSVDMHEMCRIKWIDYQSGMGCIEAGIIGKDLDAQLAKMGLMLGHEPDSSEFSSLGGWVATRASGMKKNVYGNIEDLLLTATMVTARGTLVKNCEGPRMSTGPDVNEIILGSEGTLGIITEAVVKLRPLPACRRYGSIVFPSFEAGVACLREIAKQRCAPASIRLVDNMQFQFGQVLKPSAESHLDEIIDAAKKWYVTSWKGFQVDQMVAATLLFEGAAVDVTAQETRVYSIASQFGGIKGGEENGRRGYFLTWMIAYIRDFGFDHSMMSESFETSCPWANVLSVSERVKETIVESCKKYGIKKPPFVSCRVTQSYDTGACIYFYFGFIFSESSLPSGGAKNPLLPAAKSPLEIFESVEREAREKILSLGGSLSHHHGIGKLRKRWMERMIGPLGLSILKSVKDSIDPNNIFNNGNLL